MSAAGRPPDRIFLEGLSFVGFHGVYPEERQRGQRFEVDLELLCCCALAGQSDRLQDTVDYAALAQLILDVGTARSYHLIEALAAALADAVLQRHPELQVCLTVRKFPAALPGSPRAAGVRIVRGPRAPLK